MSTMPNPRPVSLDKAPTLKRPRPTFWQIARMDTWALLGVLAVVTLAVMIPYMALTGPRDSLAAAPFAAGLALALAPLVAWRVRALRAVFERVVLARARLVSDIVLPMQGSEMRHIAYAYEWQGQELQGKTSVSGRLAHDARLVAPAPGADGWTVWVDPQQPKRTFLPALYD